MLIIIMHINLSFSNYFMFCCSWALSHGHPCGCIHPSVNKAIIKSFAILIPLSSETREKKSLKFSTNYACTDLIHFFVHVRQYERVAACSA